MPKLRDILEAATPGPWHYTGLRLLAHDPHMPSVGAYPYGREAGGAVVLTTEPKFTGQDAQADARLAALAPELAAWGLDVFERHAHLLDDDLLNRWQKITGGE